MNPHTRRTPINVDDFDHPFNRASNSIAVVRALAAAKAETEEPDEMDMWFGIAELMERALSDVKVMSGEYTRAANYLHELETSGSANPAPPRKKKGGA